MHQLAEGDHLFLLLPERSSAYQCNYQAVPEAPNIFQGRLASPCLARSQRQLVSSAEAHVLLPYMHPKTPHDIPCPLETPATAWHLWKRKDLALSAIQVKAAKEEYVGVWIHGVLEEDLKFFLGHTRVPCFLIHELVEGEAPGKLVVTDFVQGTPVAQLLDPQNSEYNRVALRLNREEHTLHNGSLPLPGVAFHPNDKQLLSRSRNQYGPHPLERSVRSESPGGVSIPSLDKNEELPADERAMVSTSSEWTATLRSMILRAEVMVAMMEEVKITPILKFTVPNTFTLEGMKGWLSSAMKRVVGGRWQEIVCVEWHPRAHYYIEFNMDNTVLHVKGLVDTKDGKIQPVEFTRSREFNEVLRKHPVIVSCPRYSTTGAYQSGTFRYSDTLQTQVPSVTLHTKFSTWTHTLLSKTGLRVPGIRKKLLPMFPFSPVHISLFAIAAVLLSTREPHPLSTTQSALLKA
ncbi:hypothetical protein DFH08DRAFT_955893 [Mycena albidolilacea]|uniref:Uncharacterized protein n=1 Tax=Mycena albidolilacea TaxID=1033008 RepID=A0AAD7AC24_9AGAR|nr:hypothetical protein DFH08DRAFT_955893 [Mycena albidolilacea]